LEALVVLLQKRHQLEPLELLKVLFAAKDLQNVLVDDPRTRRSDNVIHSLHVANLALKIRRESELVEGVSAVERHIIFVLDFFHVDRALRQHFLDFFSLSI